MLNARFDETRKQKKIERAFAYKKCFECFFSFLLLRLLFAFWFFVFIPFPYFAQALCFSCSSSSASLWFEMRAPKMKWDHHSKTLGLFCEFANCIEWNGVECMCVCNLLYRRPFFGVAVVFIFFNLFLSILCVFMLVCVKVCKALFSSQNWLVLNDDIIHSVLEPRILLVRLLQP